MQTKERSNTSVAVRAYAPTSIKAVLLPDGEWHKTTSCELVQFAIGEAHSPVTPSKFYPHLEFSEGADRLSVALSDIQGYRITE